jgi:hypothetical protein
LRQSLEAIQDRGKEAVAQPLEYRQGGYKERKPSGHTETGLSTNPTTGQEGKEKKKATRLHGRLPHATAQCVLEQKDHCFCAPIVKDDWGGKGRFAIAALKFKVTPKSRATQTPC